MARERDAAQASILLVLTVFLFATDIRALITSPMADRFGRRPVLLVTGAIYLFATTPAWFAPGLETLRVARVLQASTAASLSISRAIIRHLCDRSRAAPMMGHMTMGITIMSMIAPSLGGILGKAFGRRSTCLLLDAIALAVLLPVWFNVRDTYVPTHGTVGGKRATARPCCASRFFGNVLAALLTLRRPISPFEAARLLSVWTSSA